MSLAEEQRTYGIATRVRILPKNPEIKTNREGNILTFEMYPVETVPTVPFLNKHKICAKVRKIIQIHYLLSHF